MGFFGGPVSVKLSKKGRNHLTSGNFREALACYSEAAERSEDQKTFHEAKAIYFLLLAILSSIAKKNETGIKNYIKFMNHVKLFEEECDKTPGFGTRTRHDAFMLYIQDILKKYSSYIAKLTEHMENK